MANKADASKRSAGRPRIHHDARRHFTIEIPVEVAEALDRARGSKSKAAFIEEVFRSNPEIAAILRQRDER